jgi:hypothetical protein
MNDFVNFTPSYTSTGQGVMIFNLQNFVSVDSDTTYNETYYYTAGVALSNSSVVPFEMTVIFPDNKYTYHYYQTRYLPALYYKTPNTKISTYATPTPTKTTKKSISTQKPTLITSAPAPALTPTSVPTIGKPSTPTPVPSLSIMQPSDLLPKKIPGFGGLLTIIGLIGSLIVFMRLKL